MARPQRNALLHAAGFSSAYPAAIWAPTSYLVARLRTESLHLGGDPVLDDAAKRLADEAGPVPADAGALPAVVPTCYRAGGMVLSLISTIAQFGSAEDIAFADLKIELMFPADDITRDNLMVAHA